jgi:hypothetical protein
MRKKIIFVIAVTLMITSMSFLVLAAPTTYDFSGRQNPVTAKTNAVNLDVAITTDWVNDWQDHGLRIREYALDGSVWAYSEISSDDLIGLYFTQKWWYDNGTGLEFKWAWSWTIGEHWTSSATWSWWQIGLDYGKGIGVIETLVDNVSLGYSNWYSVGGNSPPETPTITGETDGEIDTSYDYTFTGTDPDGFQISYFVDWGDDTTTEWTTFSDSSDPIILAHTFTSKGDYTITCKVKDHMEKESDWGTLIVTMPYSYNPFQQFFELLFQRFPNAFPILRQLLGF